MSVARLLNFDAVLAPRAAGLSAGAGRFVLGLLLLFPVYLLFDRIGLFLQLQYGGLTPLWPASGLALAVFWRGGLRWWPVIAAGEAVTAWTLGQGIPMLVLGPLAQLVEAGLALAMLDYLRIEPELRRVRDVLGFTGMVAALAPVPSALIGAVGLMLDGQIAGTELLSAAFVWWLGDAMGLLIVTPALVIWQQWPFHGWRANRRWLAPMLVWTLIGAGLILADGEAADYLFFLLLPGVAWLSMRAGRAGAASAALLLAVLVFGLNSLRGAPDAFLTAVRVAFVGVSAVTGYLLAAVRAEQRSLLRELRRRAAHDGLTGLLNRGAFQRRLEDLLGEGDGDTHALLYLDLDQFKIINDTCGHAAGDRMLAQLAHLLEAEVDASYIFARLGGDEFAVLIPGGTEPEALYVAEKLRRAILDFRYPYGDLTFSFGVSIGVTLVQPHDTPEGVMTRADIACYSAKREGRNRVHTYRADDLEMRRQHSELRWISQMHRAMQDGSLQLYVQRIAAFDPGASPFYEVLLRYVDGERVTSPAAFLPVAARYGLMPEIDHWVLAQSLQALAAAQDPGLRLSINLSGTTLDSPRFVDDMLELIERYGVSPHRICLEITESIAIDRLTRAQSQMRWLQDIGFTFALDDFGSGVASFGYLQKLPVGLVKIDGRFVKGLEHDTANLIIIEALVRLAKSRGIQCVAEWVETELELERLKVLGVDMVQGFYLHTPERLTNILTPAAIGPADKLA